MRPSAAQPRPCPQRPPVKVEGPEDKSSSLVHQKLCDCCCRRRCRSWVLVPSTSKTNATPPAASPPLATPPAVAHHLASLGRAGSRTERRRPWRKLQTALGFLGFLGVVRTFSTAIKRPQVQILSARHCQPDQSQPDHCAPDQCTCHQCDVSRHRNSSEPAFGFRAFSVAVRWKCTMIRLRRTGLVGRGMSACRGFRVKPSPATADDSCWRSASSTRQPR
jgi:hypothetical protein